MRVKKFQKRKEDFVCDNCGAQVKGDGFTNHCPECLWSKHVDIFPGDRLEDCHGLMEPVDLESKKDDFVLTHKCVKCEHISKTRSSAKDNPDAILKLNDKLAEEKFDRLIRG